MSYPFGFSEDYKGFLARSVLLPVFLFIAALYVAASRRRMSRTEHLDLLALALILGSLPCFYHFEAVNGVSAPTFWGLVDSFLAAAAALAFATGYRAFQSKSWLLLFLASLLAGLCLIIKPAGVIVALVIVSLLVVLKIVNDLKRPAGSRFSAQRVSFATTVSTGTGLLIVAAINPHYLSRSVPLIVASVIVALMVSLKFINDLNRPTGSRFSAQLIPYLITAAAGAGLLIVAAIKPHYFSRPVAFIVALIIVALMISLKLINDLNRPFARWFSLQLVPFIVTVSAGTGLLLLAAISSNYLSRESIQWGNQAVAVLRHEFASPISLESLKNALYPSFGLNALVLGLAAAFSVVKVCQSGIQRGVSLWTLIEKLLNPLLAVAVLPIGTFFWLMYADLSQVRYFYPFAFLTLLLMAVFLLDTIRGNPARWTRTLIYGCGGILFTSLITMLYFDRAGRSWQQAFGVTLTSSSGHEARRLADLLLQKAKTGESGLDVYALDVGYDFGTIHSAGLLEKLLRPGEPSINVTFPVDWQHPSAVLFKDLVYSDYILYHPIRYVPGQHSVPMAHQVGSLRTEIQTIAAWLTQANEESGVKDLAIGKFAIKQVLNPRLFAHSLANLAAAYQWPDAFKSENADFFENAESTNCDGTVENSGGDGREIFNQTIEIDSVQVETVSPLIFAIDWRALSGNIPDDLFFFVHVLDRDGNISANAVFPLNRRLSQDAGPAVSHHTLLKTYGKAGSGSLRYGFGIYQGARAERLLTPDPVGVDFGGNRVVREVQVR